MTLPTDRAPWPLALAGLYVCGVSPWLQLHTVRALDLARDHPALLPLQRLADVIVFGPLLPVAVVGWICCGLALATPRRIGDGVPVRVGVWVHAALLVVYAVASWAARAPEPTLGAGLGVVVEDLVVTAPVFLLGLGWWRLLRGEVAPTVRRAVSLGAFVLGLLLLLTPVGGAAMTTLAFELAPRLKGAVPVWGAATALYLGLRPRAGGT